MNAKELAGQLATKRAELSKIFEDNTKDGQFTLTETQRKEVNDRNDELTKLAEQYKEAKGIEDIQAANAQGLADLKNTPARPPFADANGKEGPEEPGTGLWLPNGKRGKTLGDLFVESKTVKEFSVGHGPAVALENVDIKSLMTTTATTAGYPPQVLRSGVVIYSPQAQPTLIDIIPSSDTEQNAYKYMQETVFTNAAAETAEGALYPEAALKYAEVLSPVRKISVFIPVTDEQMADEPGLRGIIDNRLTLMLRQRLNSQLINGDGTGVNLTGILNTSGIQTEPIGTDVAPDAIYKAAVKVETIAFAEPDAVVMNPTNWQTIRLSKTTYGSYIWGDPATPGPQMIFGYPVVKHVNVPAGTAFVGDFKTYTQLVWRAGIEFEVSNSHADFFQRGQLAIRAQMRVGFVVYRPQAICSVTGLT